MFLSVGFSRDAGIGLFGEVKLGGYPTEDESFSFDFEQLCLNRLQTCLEELTVAIVLCRLQVPQNAGSRQE